MRVYSSVECFGLWTQTDLSSNLATHLSRDFGLISLSMKLCFFPFVKSMILEEFYEDLEENMREGTLRNTLRHSKCTGFVPVKVKCQLTPLIAAFYPCCRVSVRIFEHFVLPGKLWFGNSIILHCRLQEFFS